MDNKLSELSKPVAWEMRFWNSGHNMWHEWERITAEQHAEMSVLHAADNDYEFRVLYDAQPAPAVVKLSTEFYSDEGIVVRLEQVMAALSVAGVKYERKGGACRAEMLAQPVSSGYKLVPVEPTAEMIQSGISAHYNRQQVQVYDKPAPGPMECAYRAMLAAAPGES